MEAHIDLFRRVFSGAREVNAVRNLLSHGLYVTIAQDNEL